MQKALDESQNHSETANWLLQQKTYQSIVRMDRR